MENNDNNSFRITYSAKERQEVENIRKKYIPQQEDKLQRLKRLDAQVYNKAATVSLILGIIGTLVMGTGMCCCMVWAQEWFVPGIVIGLAGIALICLAYPMYNKTLKLEREKITPEILRLTDELMK